MEALVLADGVSKQTFVEYYPVTDAGQPAQSAWHNAVKTIDYRKPTGFVTYIGFPLF